MALDKYYYYHEGFLAETTGYKTRLTIHEYLETMRRISENVPVDPSFLGLLMGRAVQISEKVMCEYCHLQIPEPNAAKVKSHFSPEKRLANLHAVCLDILEKEQKEAEGKKSR